MLLFIQKVLEPVDSAKYLGVTLSKDLTWNNHVNNMISSAYKTLGFVNRYVCTTNQSVRELAYKTLVRPQEENASTKVNSDIKVEIIQKHAT